MIDSGFESQEKLNQDGFVLMKAAVTEVQIHQLIDAVEQVRLSASAPGMRNLLGRCPHVRNFALSAPALHIATSFLGNGARPVRAFLFDKTPGANWYVTCHQDLSIPVEEQVASVGFGPWSTKHGILHVQPPAHILERMVSLRIHLDDCSTANGAIKFIAGSHRNGILDPAATAAFRDAHQPVVCAAERGDVIAMRPLTMHSSSEAEAPGHRRVLHIEYANADLPDGMQWAEA